MNQLQTLASPLGRLFIAVMFFMAGLSKIFAYQGTVGYMEAMGVPGALLPLVILTEVVLGLAIIVGFKTRLAAFALAGFSLVSAILFHANFSDQMQMTLFMKNVAIAGGFFFLVAHGGGAYSLDNRLAKSANTI
ncbi:MAG: DoxX family protein [Bermanella sp.]